MIIAIQGELGSFSHEAALALEPDGEVLPCAHSADVFDRVESGMADCAVIPIENSLAGSVLEHYDLLLARDVGIEREALIRIRHNLIAAPGAALGDIRQALSHPVALAQCRRFFATHPEIEATPFYDTAGSVKRVTAEDSRDSAAIGSAQAARQYGGTVLVAGIEDNPENYTRFFLIRRRAAVAPTAEAHKVSLAFAVENRPGTLVKALEVFAGRGTNLTRLESRPVPGKPWEYIFYADFQIGNGTGASADLRALREQCSMVKELGRYPTAVREP